METKVNDPENYYKMSEPFETPELANEALKNFYAALEEARKKYKIANVLVVVKDAVKYSDGEIGHFFQHSDYGNQLNAEPMAAYAYGQMQAEHRALINKLIANKDLTKKR